MLRGWPNVDRQGEVHTLRGVEANNTTNGGTWKSTSMVISRGEV